MNIRKLIREEIQKFFEEEESSMFGDALTGIDTQLQKDLDNVGLIIKTHQTDMKNMDNGIKADLQLKSKLDAQNPHKKGLDREIPERQKDFEARKKQLKDLEDAQTGLQSARSEIEKQQNSLKSQTNNTQKGQEDKTQSVLPNLQSPI